MTETDTPDPRPEPSSEEPSRRDVLSRATGAAMAGGLVAGYGTAAFMAGRYLYPARPRAKRWLFVCTLDRLRAGESLPYRTPIGERITVARKGDGVAAEDFIALSSVCPHLGCQVHWQVTQSRFFCPCHNGVFDAEGFAKSGPPADAGQNLSRYPLRVEGTQLFIEVPVEGLG